jgi:hypothetical protein
MRMGGSDVELECTYTLTHHHDDHKHRQSRDNQCHRLRDKPHWYPHRNKIQAPRFPQKGPFQLLQILGRGIVGIVNTAVFRNATMGGIST